MTDERPETGPMMFGNDWPGVFIRGDNAFFYANQIDATLQMLGDAVPPVSNRVLRGLASLLRGTLVAEGETPAGTTKLREYKECLAEENS